MKKFLVFLFSIFLASSVMAQPITYGTQVSDTAFSSSWNGILDIAPSKNAVYDQVQIVKSIGVWDGDYATYQLANTAAVAAGKTLFITLPWTLTANTTLTANVHVVKGGSFTKASTYTLAFSGGFQNPSNSQSFIGFSAGDVTFGYYLEVSNLWWGAGLTDVPVQCAISSVHDTIGGYVKISAGTFVVSNNLYVYGKSNFKMTGVGKDATILDGSASINLGTTPGYLDYFGTLSINGTVAHGYNDQIYISDMTIKASSDAGANAYQLNTSFPWTSNITFERVKFDGGGGGSTNQQLYAYGDATHTPFNVRVHQCDFVNSTNEAFNINSPYPYNISVTNCTFVSCMKGILLLGYNLHVKDNSFKNIKRYAIYMAESGLYSSGRTIGASVVSGNTIEGMGTGLLASDPFPEVWGIKVVGAKELYADNTEDLGLIIANNSIMNAAIAATIGYEALSIGGNVKAIGNFIAGARGGTALAYAITVDPGGIPTGAPGTGSSTVYLENNTIEATLDLVKFLVGVYVWNDNTIKVYMSNNIIRGVTNYALQVLPPGGGSTPFISLNGDILNGAIVGQGTWGTGDLNASGELNNQPLYGTNSTTLRSNRSHGVFVQTFTNNSTTPSVATGDLFYCTNSNPTIITMFNDGIPGQVIKVIFGNANTTIDFSGTNLKGNNGGDWVSADADWIDCVFADGVWYCKISESS